MTLGNLGNTYLQQGEVEKAQRCLSRTLEIQTSKFGSNHPNVACTFLILASCMTMLNDDKSAFDYAEQALNVFREHFGTQHSHTQQALQMVQILKQGLTKKQLPEPWQVRWETNDPGQAIRRIIFKGNTADLEEILLSHPEATNAQDNNSQKGYTALHLAVQHQSIHLRALLVAGARYDIKDQQGRTAMDLAIDQNQPPVLDEFISAIIAQYSTFGVSIDQLPKLVRVCAHSNDTEGLKLLIHRGVAIDVPGNDSGKTALHRAVINRHIICVQLLIGAGADPKIVDAESKTPYDYAGDDETLLASLMTASPQTVNL